MSDSPRTDALRRDHINATDDGTRDLHEETYLLAEALEREIKQMADKAASKNLAGYRELGAKCAALEYELEQCRAAAIRYQFLRERFRCNGWKMDGNHPWSFRNPPVAWCGPTVDAAIDGAIREGK